MSERFTDRLLQSIKPPPPGDRPIEMWDDLVRGLGFRVGASGTHTFHVMTRCNGRQVRHVIGPYPATRLKDAREEAGEIIRAARKGIDPREEKRRARREAERARRDTFSAIVEEFIEKYAKPRNRRWAETDRILKVNVIPEWGTRPIEQIARRDVIELLEKIGKERGGYMSNRTLATVRRLFAWCLERDVVETSPAANVRPIAKEVSRDRVLSDAELRAFWKAADVIDAPWASYFKVLALTAQRRSEVATMHWQDLSLDGDDPKWTIPRELVKADRLHSVPLALEVVGILEDLPRYDDENAPRGKKLGVYCFTTTSGERSVGGLSKPKADLDAKMLERLREAAEEAGDDPEKVELPRWTLHDLRRSAASNMARLGFPPHVVGAVLNHSPGATHGITAVYQRYRYDGEKRQALEAWARRLTQIVTDTPPANVVALTR
ncbi:MAG: site-specific integrase [Proteobacteria bacterium]|nr:site-specific integrase [Pseudomonadota bacterium]